MTTARYCFHPHEDPRCTQVTKCSLTDLNYDSCCIVTCCCPKSLTFFVRLILKALLILAMRFFSSHTRYRGCDLKSLPFLTSNCNHVHNPYTFCNLKTDHISFFLSIILPRLFEPNRLPYIKFPLCLYRLLSSTTRLFDVWLTGRKVQRSGTQSRGSYLALTFQWGPSYKILHPFPLMLKSR